MKKIMVFTHYDLDGCVSYLTAKWALSKSSVEVEPLPSSGTRERLKRWMTKHDFSDYDTVYFLDLDVADQFDLIDLPNVVVIDHHKSHEDKQFYKKATAVVKEYSSAAMLCYRYFRKMINAEYTPEQKALIVLADDYDSYTHKFPDSRILNDVFWEQQHSFDTFAEQFKNGFSGFTKQQLAVHELKIKELNRLFSSLKMFRAKNVNVGGVKSDVVATFASSFLNDICDHLIDKEKADVAIVINMDAQRVSFRRSKKSQAKLNEFAEEIADGGGHEYSAGGSLTPDFMEFTKKLVPYE